VVLPHRCGCLQPELSLPQASRTESAVGSVVLRNEIATRRKESRILSCQSLFCGLKNSCLVNGSLGRSHQCSLCLKLRGNKYMWWVGHQKGKHRVINHLKISKLLESFSNLCYPVPFATWKESGRGPATLPFLFPKGHSHQWPET